MLVHQRVMFLCSILGISDAMILNDMLLCMYSVWMVLIDALINVSHISLGSITNI